MQPLFLLFLPLAAATTPRHAMLDHERFYRWLFFTEPRMPE